MGTTELSIGGLIMLFLGLFITAQFKRLDRIEDRIQYLEDSRYQLDKISASVQNIEAIIEVNAVDLPTPSTIRN